VTRTIHLAAAGAAIALAGCSPHANSRVEAKYDQTSGLLTQLTIDAKTDGKPNIYSYMDGNKFVRIEIDKDEDGKIDRWEYYGPDQKLQKVGMSRANDGKVDSWAYEGPDGLVSRVEVSTRRNGRINRTEFYARGELMRAEEDTNGDGKVDKWETYAAGSLSSVSFDTTGSGRPNRIIDYQNERPAGK
jgi:hypothetical protein